jgi:hypothetical protein
MTINLKPEQERKPRVATPRKNLAQFLMESPLAGAELNLEGSGNVFADLGLPNAEQELLKAQLTLQIYRIVKQRGLTQTQAAKALGVRQLWLFVAIGIAKLLSDGEWTPQAKLAVGILSFSVIGVVLIFLTMWLYGFFNGEGNFGSKYLLRRAVISSSP